MGNVELVRVSDRRAGKALVMGLAPLWPDIPTVIADAGHEGRKLARELKAYAGWRLVIVVRSECAFRITGLT